MGFIVSDIVSLPSGIMVSNLYYCISDNCIYIQRFDEPNTNNPFKYKYHCDFNIFSSKEAKLNKLEPIKQFHVEVIVSENISDPYTLMYNTLKKNYNNIIDDI